jgi:hypothetical protein
MLSYGDLGDAELLRMYGFVELIHKDDDYENPNNKVMIHYDKVRRACEVSAAKGEGIRRFAPWSPTFPHFMARGT